MIAKCIKGRGFRGAVNYDLQPHKSLLLETNMAGQNPREMAREFGAIRALRPGLGKAVCHVSLSLPPGETLTDDQWREAAHAWLHGMGFGNSQYVVSRHTDAKHAHIHILANRVTFDGHVVSDAHDYKRQEPIMRSLEQRFGLQRVTPSHEVSRSALRKGEVEQAVRTGDPPLRLTMQQAVDAALTDRPDLNTFLQRLAHNGIEIRLNQATTGFISGISFAKSGIAFKGSQIGKAYTWNALQQRGLHHEQDGHYKGHDRSPEHPASGFARQRSGPSRSATDGLEYAGRGPDQEFSGIDQTFDEIKQLYLAGDQQRARGRARSQGHSR